MDSTASAMSIESERASPSEMRSTPKTVIGSILLGGSLTGALVRDVRLANELVRRGYDVHVWWAVDWQKTAGLDSRITQHWLFHGFRFQRRRGSALMETVGRALSSLFADRRRSHWSQRRGAAVEKMMTNLMHRVCDGVEGERNVVKKFAHEMEAAGVTHMLPMLEFLCPWVDAARGHMSKPPRYVVTFQGYELYSTYARLIGRERELFNRLVETVKHSDWPAIAVSEDYLNRVQDDIGVPAQSMKAIPPGVPAAKRMDHVQAEQIVKVRFPDYMPGIPVIAYLGRQDTEKGIDLLLYALSILKQRGYKFQAAICGPSLWGENYHRMCRKIAEELRLNEQVMWRRFVPDEARTALFSVAHCVVYPSIHREPFGMVAAEVVAHGTPAIVPDYGGVASAIEANGESAGLRFKVWDSGDLANQIARLLDDRELHRRLSESGPAVAEHFSVRRLADRVLEHLGIMNSQ
jgi:glycosyltransferase involved in cell wall biosynthesis